MYVVVNKSCHFKKDNAKPCSFSPPLSLSLPIARKWTNNNNTSQNDRFHWGNRDTTWAEEWSKCQFDRWFFILFICNCKCNCIGASNNLYIRLFNRCHRIWIRVSKIWWLYLYDTIRETVFGGILKVSNKSVHFIWFFLFFSYGFVHQTYCTSFYVSKVRMCGYRSDVKY